MARPPKTGMPTVREMLRAFIAIEMCLREAASEWDQIPGRWRYRLRLRADQCADIIRRAYAQHLK